METLTEALTKEALTKEAPPPSLTGNSRTRGQAAPPGVAMTQTLQVAYDFFNAELFAGLLPGAVILVHRAARARGYFWRSQFRSLSDPNFKMDEIAINPDHLDMGAEDVLSTLVHEMVHQWQYEHGKARKGYHNRQFAEKMGHVGLQCSNTGKAGGKTTGQKMTHYVLDNGRYQVAFNQFVAEYDVSLDWASGMSFRSLSALAKKLGLELIDDPEEAAEEKAKPKSKQKFTCPDCGQNAWAKPTAMIGCWDCDLQMEEA